MQVRIPSPLDAGSHGSVDLELEEEGTLFVVVEPLCH
jgi:hypothetical protein